MKNLLIVALIIFYLSHDIFGQSLQVPITDINYAGDTTVSHRMDIYLPNEVKEMYPAVILIYGSAFFGNDMKHIAFETLGEQLLEGGFAVVAINHRSSREAIFPAQIHDVKAAIRFIRANAFEYQIDTSFIGITGYSSGGHLSAFIGTSGKVGEFTIGKEQVDLEGTIGIYPHFSSSVDAVVNWFGPTDFLIMDSCGSSMSHNAPDSPESVFVGGPIQENQVKVTLANPITYVDSYDPPFLIFHGDKDPLVPHCQSELLFQELQEKGVSSQLVIIPEAGHGPGVFEEQYFRMMVDFFLEMRREKY
jgi:acetyl esterase/lipase